MTVLHESNITDTTSFSFRLGNSPWRACIIQPINGHYQTSVKVKLRRVGNPGGTLYVRLRACDPSTGKPTGGDLATSSMAANSVSTTATWYEFTWSSPVWLDGNGTRYAIICQMTAGDGSNFMNWHSNTTNTWGQYSSSNDGTTWNTVAASPDACFEDWGYSPKIATAAASDVLATQATGNGTVDDNTNLTAYGFEWRRYGETDYASTFGGEVIYNSQPPLSFSGAMPGLYGATPYYYRVKVYHTTYGWLYGGYVGRDVLFQTTHDASFVLRSYQATANQSDTIKLNEYMAQTFTPVGQQLKSVKLWLGRTGSLGDMTISIRATDGAGKPTGADLVAVTYPSSWVTHIHPSAGEYEFGLGEGILLTGGTKYALMLRCSGGDANNFIRWWYNTAGGLADGQRATSEDAGATWTLQSDDATFWEYGESGVVTFDATDIKALSAIGNGYIHDTTDITQIGFEWGTTEGGPYPDDVTETPVTLSPGLFQLDMTSLSPLTTYYYRAKVYHTTLGWLQGNEVEFTTLSPVPTVITENPTDAQTDHIDAVGNITDEGASTPTKRGFVFGLTSVFANPGNVAPGSSGYDDYEEETGTFTTGEFTLTLPNLQANRIYYIRAYAANSYGYGYGDEIRVLTNYDVNILFLNSDVSAGIRFSSQPGGGYPHPYGGTIPHYKMVSSKDCWFEYDYGYWGALHILGLGGVYERHYYNTNTYTDIYGLANPTRRTEGVLKVKWKGRAFSNEYPYGGWGRELVTHGVQYSGTFWDITMDVGTPSYGDTRCEIFYTNPFTGAAWTLAELDALQAGVSTGQAASFGLAFIDWVEVVALWANASVRTDPGEKLSSTELRLNGYVVQDEAEECEVFFEWGLTDAYGNTTTPETKRIGQYFSADLSGLDPLETYHYRAAITTACGETFYGEDALFNMYRPDRIYVWLGNESDKEVFELTEPGVDLVFAARTERGWDEELAQASTGICEIICDNFEGAFSPENVASPIYGLLYLGARVTCYEIYKGIQYNHFTGRIDKILPHAEDDNPVAYIVALDGQDDIQGTKVTTALRTDTDAGTLCGDVLDAANWPAGARDIDTGIDTLQVGWFHKKKGLDAIRDLEVTEKGRFFIKTDGDARFENRHYRITGDRLISQHSFDDTMVELAYEYSKRLLYNEILVTGRRWFAGGVELWSAHTGDTAAPYIPQATTVIIWAEFNSPLGTYTSLVKGTHWNANSQPDKSGDDLSDNITITETQYGQAVKLTIANAGSQGAYIVEPDSPPAGAPEDRTLLIYGALFSSENLTFLEEDTTSQDNYGKRTLEIDAPFKSRPNDLLAYAQWLKARYHEPVPTPVEVKHVARTGWPDDTIRIQCLVRDISDRITLSSTRLAFDADFYINKVVQEYVFLQGGTVHETTWYVEKAEGSAEGIYWLLGVEGFGELGEKTILGF